MRRWVGIGIPLILIVGIGGYWFYWNALADGLQNGFERWVADRRAEGVEVSHGDAEVTGFPYRLELHIRKPDISAPKLNAQPSWSADKLVLFFQPYQRGHGIASVEGTQDIGWSEGTVRRNARMTADQFLASFRFTDQGQILRVDTDMRKVKLSGSVALRSADRLLSRAEYRQMEDGRTAFDTKIRGEVLKVDPAASPLDEQIDLADFSFEWEPIPASTAPQDLDAWRDEGGVMQLSRMEIVAGDLSVTGDGTFALDPARRPEGAAALIVRGADAFVNAVAAAGQIGSGGRLGLRLAITALEETDKEGRRFVKVPIAIQEGRLKIMGVGLTRVRPLY
jgi:hypothetical protein